MRVQPQKLIVFLLIVLFSNGCEKHIEVTNSTRSSCLIAALTIKELIDPGYQESTMEPETIMVDGKAFRVSTTQKSVYTYDSLGRILTEYNRYEGSQRTYYGIADSTYYQYSPSTVNIRNIQFKNTGKIENNYSYKLNKQGYAESYFSGQNTYDMDGYLVSYVDDVGIPYKIVNGNIIESVLSLEGPLTQCYIYRNEYDLEKPGLLSHKTYSGRRARNLIMGYRVDGKAQWNAPTTEFNLYEATYSYTFDDKNRVKRQIFHGKNNGFIFGGGSPIQTTDFSYICP